MSSNSPANTISGRGTIWVTGDLTISSDIIIDPTSGISDPFNMSNMLIFVEGRVSIRGAVNEIDASIISLGGSDSLSNNNTCYQGQGCGKQLIIKGYFATDNFTNFRRTYFSSTDPNNNPAERIRLTGQSIALPPPGVDKRDSQQGTQLQIDAVELPPRLN